MSFKGKLNIDWGKAKQSNSKFGEVEMFESMLKWFNNNPKCSVVELHKKQVQNEDAPPQTRCEISDLLTICYSARFDCAKIQFLQAKYCDKALNNGTFTFNVDCRQYRLLKDCPYISPKQSEMPSDILKHSCSPEITSYGVFYRDGTGGLDMAYEITHMLVPLNPEAMTYQRVNEPCSFDTIEDRFGILRWGVECGKPHAWCHFFRGNCVCRPYLRRDLLSTLSVDTYMNNLLDFRVGSPICGSRLSALADGLKNLLTKCNKRFPDGFDKFIELYQDDRVQNDERKAFDFGPIEPNAILLINVDDEREERE